MRDDVVHLPGDPPPFGDPGQLGLLVALPGQLGSQVDQGGDIAFAVADRDPEESGREHEDRVLAGHAGPGSKGRAVGQVRADRRDADGGDEPEPGAPHAAVDRDRVERDQNRHRVTLPLAREGGEQPGAGDPEHEQRGVPAEEQRGGEPDGHDGGHDDRGRPGRAAGRRQVDQHGDRHRHEIHGRDERIGQPRMPRPEPPGDAGRCRQAQVTPGRPGRPPEGELRVCHPVDSTRPAASAAPLRRPGRPRASQARRAGRPTIRSAPG